MSQIELQDNTCTFTANVIGTQLLFSIPDASSQPAGNGEIQVLDGGVQYIPLYIQETLPTNVVNSYVIDDTQQLPLINQTSQIILTEDQLVALSQVSASTDQQSSLSNAFLSLNAAENSTNSEPETGKKIITEASIIVEKEDIAHATCSVQVDDSDLVDPPDKTCPQACDTCGLRFESRKLFKKHVLSHLHDKPHKCPHCSESFNHEYNFIPHLATHNEKDPYCPVCNKSFNRLAGLKAHILIHQCDDTIPCPECLEEFGTQKLLEAHRLEHKSGFVKRSNRVHCCPHCDEKFAARTFLKEHVQDVHKVKIPKKIKKGKGGYVCEFCKKRFKKPSQLVRHRRTHTGEKPFKCAECGKGFGQKGSLQIHMLKHSGLKPYSCIYCSSHFSQKGNLQAHIARIHPEEKEESRKSTCKYCSASFINIVGLENHMSRYHGFIVTDRRDKELPAELSVNDLSIRVSLPNGDSSNKENEVKGNETSELDGNGNATNPPPAVKPRGELSAKAPTTEVINKCKHCSEIFQKRADLVKHLKIHVDENKFKCICGRQFITKATLMSHVHTAHPERLGFHCDLCPSKFAVEEDLENHRKSKHKLVFDYIEPSVPLEPPLELEIPKDVQEEFVACTPEPVLLDEVASAPSLAVLDEMPFDCAKLLISSDGTIQFIRHVPIVDKEMSNEVVSSNEAITPNEVVCSNEEVELENTLQDVIEEPTREMSNNTQKHKCEFCNLAFKQKSHWKMHLRIHTGEKPFSCEICDKSFATKSALNVHLGTHDEVPAFKCEDCGRAFSTHRSLKRHMDLHVPGFMYSCSVCNRAYKTKVAWQKHLATHMKISAEEGSANFAKQVEKPELSVVCDEIDVDANSVVPLQTTNVESDDQLKKDQTTFNGDWSSLIQTLQPGNDFTFEGGSIPFTTGSVTLPTAKTSSTTVTDPQISTQVQFNDFGDRIQLFTSLNDETFDGCVFLQNGDLQPSSSTLPASSESPQTAVSTHHCSTCNLDFENLVELSIHKTTHLPDKWMTCANCEAAFNSSAELQEHIKNCAIDKMTTNVQQTNDMNTVSSDEYIPRSKLRKCTKCDVYYNAEDYLVHMSSNHKLYACKMCTSCFKNPTQLEMHLLFHKYGSSPSDKSEDAVQSEDSNVSMIEQTIDEPTVVMKTTNPAEDGSEKKPNASRERLEMKRKKAAWKRQTVRTLTEEEKLAVIKENPSSISEKILLQSILRQIATQEKEAPKETEAPEYPNQCKYCPKSFRKPSDLVRHLRVHTGERPYMCTSCNKSFSIKSTAKSHVKIHKKERLYKCHICHNYFAAIGSLKVHMRLHTGAKPFACEMCPARFRTSGHRKSHMFSHQRKENLNKEKDRLFLSLPVEQRESTPPPPPDSSPKKVPSPSSFSFPYHFLMNKSSEKPLGERPDKAAPDSLDAAKKPGQSNFLFSLDGGLNFGERIVEGSSANQQFFLKEVKGDDRAGTAAHFVVTMGDEISYQDNINDLLESVPHLNGDHDERFKLDLDIEVNKEPLAEEVCETCSVCGKKFSSCLELDNHTKKEHLVNNVLSCNVCKQNFRGKTDLVVHMLVHELDQLSCHACSLEFPDEGALRKHKCANEDSEMKSMATTSLDLASVVHDFFSFPTL